MIKDFLSFALQIVTKLLCACLCLFNQNVELHTRYGKVFNDFLIGKARGCQGSSQFCWVCCVQSLNSSHCRFRFKILCHVFSDVHLAVLHISTQEPCMYSASDKAFSQLLCLALLVYGFHVAHSSHHLPQQVFHLFV